MMSKDNKQIDSVSIPYLPNYGEDIMPPEYFEKTIKPSHLEGAGVDPKKFKLDEIQGTRLVYLDGEWADHGHVAIYRRFK